MSLNKAQGSFYDFYIEEKHKEQQRLKNAGFKIVPTAKLPMKDDKRYEPEGVISEGHVHERALRKMVKLFLACLWLVWRQMEGLPITKPYAIDKLGHSSFIDPWSMTDGATNNEKTIKVERARDIEKTMGRERASAIEKTIGRERAIQ